MKNSYNARLGSALCHYLNTFTRALCFSSTHIQQSVSLATMSSRRPDPDVATCPFTRSLLAAATSRGQGSPRSRSEDTRRLWEFFFNKGPFSRVHFRVVGNEQDANMQLATTLEKFDIEIHGWYVDRPARILAGMAMGHGATDEQVRSQQKSTRQDLLSELEESFYYMTMVGARIWIKAALVINGAIPKEVYLAEGLRLARDTQAIMNELNRVAATRIPQDDLFATEQHYRHGIKVWEFYGIDRGMYSCLIKPEGVHTPFRLPERGWTRSAPRRSWIWYKKDFYWTDQPIRV